MKQILYVLYLFIFGLFQQNIGYGADREVQFDVLYPQTQFQKTLELCMCALGALQHKDNLPYGVIEHLMTEFKKVDRAQTLPHDFAYLARLVALVVRAYEKPAYGKNTHLLKSNYASACTSHKNAGVA